MEQSGSIFNEQLHKWFLKFWGFFNVFACMEKGSRSYQLGLCVEQDVAIVLHEQNFPVYTKILVLLSLGF